MAVSDGDTVTVVKDMGLVATVFDERTLSGLAGPPGHRPHPLLDARLVGLGGRPAGLPAGRPGRLRARAQRQPDQHDRAGREGRHAARLRRHRQRRRGRAAGARRSPRPRTWRTALQAVLPILEGAFSFVLMSSERLFGVRDPYGFRPLCLGRLGPADAPEGWVLASETPALSVIGATFVREVEPGEMVVIDADGPTSLEIPWLRDGGAAAVHLRVRLHRPARQPALRPRGPRDALPHGRAAGRPGAGRGRHGDGRARVGRARRPRASPGPAASPTGRGW